MTEHAAETVESVERAAKTRFVKGTDGRTYFYPFGLFRAGYLIDDPKREVALLEIENRRRGVERRLSGFVGFAAIPFLFAIYALWGDHPFLALTAPAAAAIACSRAYGWWWYRGQLSGLERVSAKKGFSSTEWSRFFWIGFGLVVLVALLLFLYSREIATLPENGTIATFYPDISKPILFVLLFGALAIGCVVRWGFMVERFGEGRATLSFLFFLLVAIIQLAIAVTDFTNPKGQVILTDHALFCGWRVPWSQISEMTEVGGRRGEKKLEVSTIADGTQRCEITSLNVGSTTIYQQIQATWQARRAAAEHQRQSPAAITNIVPGATTEQVIAVYGEPTWKFSFEYESYYYRRHAVDDAAGESKPHLEVLAFYLKRGRVERIARYRYRGNQIVDEIYGKIYSGEDRGFLQVIALDPTRINSPTAPLQR